MKDSYISQYDDHLVASLVSQCRDIMQGQPTVSKMTACYNLTSGVVRLFCVQGEKKDVIDLVNEFHKGLLEQIDNSFRHEES